MGGTLTFFLSCNLQWQGLDVVRALIAEGLNADIVQNVLGKRIKGNLLTKRRVIVRNLDPAVTEADVREIFSRVGKLKSAVVQYNAKGKSRGIATVTFVTKANADKAARDYDQAEVDGRPMYVKIVNYSSPGSSATPVISKAKSVKKKTQQKNTKKKPTPKKNQASKKKKTAKKTPKKGKKATKKGKKSPKKKKKKPVVTAEQLDAEMDEYHSKGTGSSKTGKSSTSLIAAGQPDPAKLFSIPTDMEE